MAVVGGKVQGVGNGSKATLTTLRARSANVEDKVEREGRYKKSRGRLG